MLLMNLESDVARKHAAQCSYFDRSASRARRHFRFNVGIGFNLERCRRAIKADTRRARKIIPQNDHALPCAAKVRIRFHERVHSHRQTEDRAGAGGSAKRRTIKDPVGCLDKPCLRSESVRTLRRRTKVVQRSQLSRGCDLKKRAAAHRAAIRIGDPSGRSGSVEISIAALYQLIGADSVRAVWQSAKVIQRTQSTLRSQFVDKPVSVLPALGSPVEVPVG